MRLRKPVSLMESGLLPIISIVSKIAAGVIAVMMILTVVDVVGRRVFNSPVPGAFELSEFMLIIVVFFTIVHCEFQRGHIKIGLLVSHFPQRVQDFIDSIVYFFFLVTFFFITWQLALQGMQAWEYNLTSGLLRVPAYPFIFVAALGCALFCLIVLMHLIQFMAGALKK